MPWGLIRPIKIRSIKIIASFDNNINDSSVQFINKVNWFEDQSDLQKSDL